MAVLKFKDIKNMNEKEMNEKLKDLKMELIKKNITANKSSKVRAKEIKKAIARLIHNSSSKKADNAPKIKK
jgi:ribosomal protein L29